MSEEPVENIDQQNDAQNSSLSVSEDELFESCNKLPFNNSKSIKNENDFDNIKCSNTYRNNILKTLKTLNTVSMVNQSNNNCNNNLIKTNNSPELSQLSQTESKYLITILCGSFNANINSQDEKIILNMVQKNIKHIMPSNEDISDINTQLFMDLNLRRVINHLQETQQHGNVSKKQSVEPMESDDSVFFTPSSMKSITDTIINSKNDNKDIITVIESKKLEQFNDISSKTDVELTYQMDCDEIINQDEDFEISHFRAMCEAMTNIGSIDKQVKPNSNVIGIVKNQINNIVLEKISEDALIVNDDVKCVPNTNKLISSVDSNRSNHTSDISICLKRKRNHCNSPKLNLFSDSSPELFNELSQKQFNCQNKKTKLTSLQNTSKLQSKSWSKKIENHSTKNVINCITLTSSEDEDCMLFENKSSKVNSAKNNYKHKTVQTDSSEQNKFLIKKEQIFYCSPNGLIHRDMLKYMN